MIQGYVAGENLAEVLNAAFALSATRLPIGKAFWVVGGGLLTLKDDDGNVIMDRNGKPKPFPVLLIRFRKTNDETAPAGAAKGTLTATSGKRLNHETIATKEDHFKVGDEVLFLSTICRDVRDAVDDKNHFMRLAHEGVVADTARAALAAADSNEKAITRICKAIYDLQDTRGNGKPWALVPKDCTKLTRDGRRYPAYFVDMVQVD